MAEAAEAVPKGYRGRVSPM